MLDWSAEGRLRFCSEPRELVVHLTLHLRSRYSLEPLHCAASSLHLYASSVRKLTLYVLCSGGLIVLHYFLDPCRE